MPDHPPKEKQLVHLDLGPDILKALDDYQFGRRFRFRSQALRQLLRDGLGLPAEKRPSHGR